MSFSYASGVTNSQIWCSDLQDEIPLFNSEIVMKIGDSSWSMTAVCVEVVRSLTLGTFAIF